MSGSSTPRKAMTPPPGGASDATSTGPSPLTIGKKFVKQYYQVLSTTPDQIFRFYQTSSVLSRGEGSTPTDPVVFEAEYGAVDAKAAAKLKDRFFVKDLQIRFEFEHGAIDAQSSLNGGILLVVTGHVVYFPSADEDEDAAVDDPIRKGFVHTFFLGVTSGTKRYYVHNDILRFLKPETEMSSSDINVTSPVPPPPKTVTEPVVETTKTSALKPEQPTPKEEKAQKANIETTTLAPAEDEAPGGGVEETKEELLVVLEPLNKKPIKKEDKVDTAVDGKGGKEDTDKDAAKGKPKSKSGNKDGGRKSPAPSPAPKPPPGSWASLVAGSGTTAAAAPAATNNGSSTSAERSAPPAQVLPPTPQPPSATGHVKSKADNKPSSSSSGNKDIIKDPNAGNPHAANASKLGARPPKRDPDCTLVIKNLADGTKESDVLAVFEQFAKDTKTRVVGITVSAHRGIAFVDYDSVQPVMMAVELHQKEPLRLLGRALEVDQKTAEQRARRAAQGGRGGGGSYRSGSPSNGGNRYGGGGRGGGGGHYGRRGGGGRGDRGGGGRGGRGGR